MEIKLEPTVRMVKLMTMHKAYICEKGVICGMEILFRAMGLVLILTLLLFTGGTQAASAEDAGQKLNILVLDSETEDGGFMWRSR